MMDNKTIKWIGIFKATLFTLIFLLMFGALLALYMLFFVHFDKNDGFLHGIQIFCDLFIAGLANAWPIMLYMTLLIFILLVSWKIISDMINYFRGEKNKL